MHNSSLIEDYLKRAEARLKALEVLYKEKSYADVVRESQEIVELSLKALLRANQIEAPRIHDVSDIIKENKTKFSKIPAKDLDKCCKISHSLRRDRELAFYGTEDLTPSEFYSKDDAEEAKNGANTVYNSVRKSI